MATTQEDIRRWLAAGKEKGATHMIVVCDTFDWTDEPVYVMPGEDARERHREEATKGMQKVMEVYSYAVDLEKQLGERRAFHFETEAP